MVVDSLKTRVEEGAEAIERTLFVVIGHPCMNHTAISAKATVPTGGVGQDVGKQSGHLIGYQDRGYFEISGGITPRPAVAS